MSDVEKMHYLKTSLSCDALRYITNIPISSESFSVAWDTLVSRYENKRFIISAHLDRLVNLKPLKTKSAKDLNTFIVTISESLGALCSLGCEMDSWDPLLLHSLIKLLDNETREAWELKLGSSTAYSTFAKFEDFIIGRTRAMQNLSLNSLTSNALRDFQKRHKSSHHSNTSAFTATTTTSKEYSECPLCKSAHCL